MMPHDVLCQHFEDHTPCPEGYIQWHYWTEKMGKTHTCRKCDGCGLYVIWEPKAAPAERGDHIQEK